MATRRAGRGTGNSRNGTSAKTVLTEDGEVAIEVPRDRAGTFEPRLIAKGQTRFDGFDDKVISLYARGLRVREIQAIWPNSTAPRCRRILSARSRTRSWTRSANGRASRSIRFIRWCFSTRCATVADVLERGAAEFGYPKTIRVDNGPEFVSKELDLWAYRRGVVLDFSRPGKPTDNAYIESLNGKLRAECLNAHWFTSIEEMRRICEDWRRDYNEVRPHSALGNKPPMA